VRVIVREKVLRGEKRALWVRVHHKQGFSRVLGLIERSGEAKITKV